MSYLIEKAPGFKSGLADFGKYTNAKTVTAGLVAAIFGCTGPALITITAGTSAGYSTEQIASWLFAIYLFGGLISIVMAFAYKQPIAGAWSIPGATMLGTALVGFTFNEAGAAFIIAGILVLLLGISGLIGKVMRWIPLPIVMGMITGAMLRFGTGVISSTKDAPIIGFAAIIGFFIVPRLIKKFPPVLAALILGIIAVLATNGFNAEEGGVRYIPPQFVVPHFNAATILSVSLPLAVLVIGAENAQATGVLFAQGYKPPINAMTIISGIGGIVTGFFGGHNANIAGPMTAICSSEEAGDNKEGRYAASIWNGIFFGGFGLIASFAITFIKAIPSSMINVIAGLAMINVLLNALQEAFGPKRFKVGAFFALVIAMSGITIFKIGAAFWALVGGVIISFICERKDFDKQEAR